MSVQLKLELDPRDADRVEVLAEALQLGRFLLEQHVCDDQPGTVRGEEPLASLSIYVVGDHNYLYLNESMA